MKYKYIIFDWDNTLANTGSFWTDAYLTVSKSYGINLSFEEVLERFKKQRQGEKVHDGNDYDSFWTLVNEEVAKLNANVTAEYSAIELINFLTKNGNKLAIVSSSKSSSLNAGLRALNIHSSFQAMISRDEVVEEKPSPEGVFKVMELLAAKTNETIIIGDKDVDVLAGKAAGIDTVLYLPSHHITWFDFEEFRKTKPTYLIKTLKDLTKILT